MVMFRGVSFRRFRRLSVHGQRGQSLVIVGLMMTVLLGMTGLVIDGSSLQETQRQLQNAADAAAFAGVADLPGSPTQAVTDADTYLSDNGSSSGEAINNTP